MDEQLDVISERVDGIPVVLAQMQGMGIASLLDGEFASHGNWQGLSLGWVAAIWLTHVLSEGDHRLSHVQAWVEQRLGTLRRISGQPVQALDFSDDRLALVLLALSDDERWAAFETALSRQLLRVYDLSAECVRLDSTTTSGYWTVTDKGLFQFGHSQDHRADLPQVKVMLATLDPLGLPLASEVLSGEHADDPLYVPAITRVRAGLQRRGLLYVGDCKMASLATRAFVVAGEDFYLCPLPAVQVSAGELRSYLQPVWQGVQVLTPVYRLQEDGSQKLIAQGYERQESLTAQVAGQQVTWQERRLVVRSLQQAQAGEAALRTRLSKAVAAIESLSERKQGKKLLSERQALQEAAEAILVRHSVQGLVNLSYSEQVSQIPVRCYGNRPATMREQRQVSVTAVVEEEPVEAAVRALGWRVYASNQPVGQLPLEQAILAYRSEYLIERSFGRLKGRPMSVAPMYLQRDDHATGLIRLLTIGLRVLVLLEFLVRRRLSEEQSKLAGLYAGNPKRSTVRPTAEMLLEAFKHITLTLIHERQQSRCHLTPLTPLQERILRLLGLSPLIFTHLCLDSSDPRWK
jgi:transposase